MGVGYILVNNTKREQISFMHISASSRLELAGNPVAAAITTWYLIDNLGDEIAFITDTHGDWPFRSGSKDDLHQYREVTGRIVEDLLVCGILKDYGKDHVDKDEPDLVYTRDLRNVWMVGDPS